MAVGLKVGLRVRATCRGFKGLCGVVKEVLGTSRSRKWKVQFDNNVVAELSARSLEDLNAPRVPKKKAAAGGASALTAESEGDSDSDAATSRSSEGSANASGDEMDDAEEPSEPEPAIGANAEG